MDVKTLIVKDSKKLFESRIKEFLEKGYKLEFSNLTVINTQQNLTGIANITKNTPVIYFYAVFIKE